MQNDDLFDQSPNNSDESINSDPHMHMITDIQKSTKEPEVTVEQCKDMNGNWTKWIMQRCNPEQLDLFKRTQIRVK